MTTIYINIYMANFATIKTDVSLKYLNVNQIALIDLLRTVDIIPDGILGHSLGELACGYADGCLTAEQMLLAAYYRGIVSQNTSFIRGCMAAVGKFNCD